MMMLMKCNHKDYADQLDILETKNKYYLLITANNTPGVIGSIGEIFAKNNLSIASVIQKGIDKENTAEIVVITEECKEAFIKATISDLENNKNIMKIKLFHCQNIMLIIFNRL